MGRNKDIIYIYMKGIYDVLRRSFMTHIYRYEKEAYDLINI